MIKLLDRYVTGLFLLSAGIFLLTFTAIFILVDFVTKVSLFFSLKDVNTLSFILRYYLLRLPMLMQFVLPMVTLFGAVFTITRLSKNNELVPMVTAGWSLRRIAAPLLVGTILSGVAVFTLEEHVLPRASEESAEMDSTLASKGSSYYIVAYNENGEHLYAYGYYHAQKQLRGVRYVRVDENHTTRYALEAAWGVWNPDTNCWVFIDGHYLKYDVDGRPLMTATADNRPVIDDHKFGKEGHAPKIGIVPADLQKTFFLSRNAQTLESLRDKMARYPDVPAYRIQYHSKLAFPLSPLLLLLLGLPTVVAIGERGMMRGLALCLIVSMGYYLCHFVCLDMGHRGVLRPLAASWTPAVLFGGIGLTLFARMRT